MCSRRAAAGTAGLTATVFGATCELDSRFAEAKALTLSGAPAIAPTVLSNPINVRLNTVLDATTESGLFR